MEQKIMRQPCRACGSPLSKYQFTIAGNRVFRCKNCTHIFLDVLHTNNSIKEMYANYGKEKRNFYHISKEDNKYTSNVTAYIKTIEQLIPCQSSRSTLLDIGCGRGFLLSQAKKNGFTIEGIEICKPLAEQASKDLTCIVHTDPLVQLNLPNEKFDVVTMYDLIEHLQDPIKDLKKIWYVLKPGGILFVLTPNDNSLVRRISRLLFYSSGYKTPMKSLYYSHHLSYFTYKSIRALLETTHFELLKIETKNQELARLHFKKSFHRFGVLILFSISRHFKSLGGKYVIYARKKN